VYRFVKVFVKNCQLLIFSQVICSESEKFYIILYKLKKEGRKMTGINSINSALPQTAQKPAFGKNEKKYNYGAAAASAILPGSGQLIKGEKKDGFTRMGVEAGLIGALGLAGKFVANVAKDFKQGNVQALTNMKAVKPLLAITTFFVAPGLILSNHINAAVNAFKPKKD